MRQGTPCEPGYFLPEEAHQQLQSLSHYLHLLAELSQPEHTNPDHLILPALAWPTASPSWPKPPTRSSSRPPFGRGKTL